MEWVIARATCTMCAIIHSLLPILTECVLSTKPDPVQGAGVTQQRLLLAWSWQP